MNKRIVSKIKIVLSNHGVVDLVCKFLAVTLSQLQFRIKFINSKVEDNKVVFESFQGKGVCDSPLAIYNVLLKTRSDLQFVWVLDSYNHEYFDELSNNYNTSIVLYNSKEYERQYATARYWIVNCRLPFRFVKRKEQKYIQCWHGTPLKRLGLDIDVGGHATTSMLGMKYSYNVDSKRYDYFLSPSRYATERFCSSFNIPHQKILEEGYPRNDTFAHGDLNISKIKERLGISEGKTIVLYAPTWRDKQFSSLNNSYFFDNPLEEKNFVDAFDESFVFLFRGHYFTESYNASDRFINVSNYNNVNDLYFISNILITDYSSVFFDYAILNRPIFFYMYDRDHYEKEARGFYLDIDNELPGPIINNKTLLANAIKSAKAEQKHQEFNLRFNPYSDGCSTERVIKRIL